MRFHLLRPVTLELRSSRLSRAQKILPSVATVWPITVFAPIPRQQYVVTAFLLRPTSIHHAPYHAQHHARITLELRPLRLYRDQSDRVAYKRRFYYAQATLTAPQLRAHHALGAT